MSYLISVHSIDDIGNIAPINNLNLNVQNHIQDNKKDFNYNDLSIKEISAKKMPFINRNRKVFCNSNVD